MNYRQVKAEMIRISHKKLTQSKIKNKKEKKTKCNKSDTSEWSCTIFLVCMGRGGTFGVQFVPQRIRKFYANAKNKQEII